jgi:hypothetical protein
MLRTRFGRLAVLVAVLLAKPLAAHHSFPVEFDGDKPIKIEGVITEVRWENPHTWIYIDGKDDKGNIVKWTFESKTPNQLFRDGVTRDILSPGVEVTMKGYRARDLSKNYAALSEFDLKDGRNFCAPPSGSCQSRWPARP